MLLIQSHRVDVSRAETTKKRPEIYSRIPRQALRRRDEGMEFPADVLEALSHGELERSAHSYMNELLYADPDHAQHFTLPSGKKVQISLSSVGFVPLYGANLQHKVLALFTPQDQLTAVALFLANQWYSLEDILKTANSRREGLVKVRSVGERIVLYVLNRIVYRTKEMSSGEMPFLCHSENDYAKIFWKNGEAVGFYSVKQRGSICDNSLRQSYILPVMDSIFVRKAYRGKGYGLQMLEDFVDSFSEDELGLKYPLSPAMTNVCRHYMDRYPADVDLFWEVEGIGGPYQRTSVAYKLASRPLNDTRKSGHGGDNGQNGDIVEDEVEESENTCLNITEEVVMVNKHVKVTEEGSSPITTHSNEHRQRKRVRNEDEAKMVDSRPDKINRMEMTEDEKDVIPADVVNESVFDTPTEALVSPKEVNCKQAEDKDGAEVEQECALKNGMGDEEKEIEAEEQAKEYTDLFQKDVCHTVDTPEEPAATQQEVASVAEEHHDMELGTVAHVHQDDDPAAEGRVVENEQQEVGTQVAPAAEEEWEVAPANEVVGPASEDEQEEVSVSEKEKPKAPTTEEGEATVAEEKQDVAYGKNKVVPAADEEWEVASEMEKSDSVSVSEKELEVRTEIEDNEVVPKVAKQEVDPSSTELSASLAPDAEEAQAQEEAMDVGNDSGDETDMSEQSYKEEGSQSSGDRPNTLVVEEEEATENEDEMDEEEKNLDETSDSSKGLRGARTSAGPTTSKRTSNRLSKITLQDEEDEQGVEEAVEEDKGMSTEEEKVTTEEEAEHSSDEEAQGQDPPVIDKRVLRGKTKVIQTMQRTRTKRRGKM